MDAQKIILVILNEWISQNKTLNYAMLSSQALLSQSGLTRGVK